MKKRLLSMLLVVCMLVSLVSTIELTASAKAKSYSITFSKSPDKGGSVTPSASGSSVVSGNKLSISIEASQKYSMSVNGNELTVKTGSNTLGSCTATADTANGYVFAKWEASTEALNKDSTATAYFERPMEGTVAAGAPSGSGVTFTVGGKAATSANAGDSVTAVAASVNGYIVSFSGTWGANSTGTGNTLTIDSTAGTFTMPDGKVVVTATYTPVYNLTGAASPNNIGGGVSFTVGGSSVTAAIEGASVTATATSVTGYSVALSSADVTVAQNGTFTMPAKAVTVTATYTAIDYNLTGAASPNSIGGGVTFTVGGNPATTANIGDTVTATATTVDGYSVVLSSTDVTVAQDGTFTMPAKAVTVTATYTAGNYNLSDAADPNNIGGGVTFTVGGNPATTAYYNDTVTATATPVDGYSAALESLDVTFGAGGTFTMPALDVLVVAKYTIIDYDLTGVASPDNIGGGVTFTVGGDSATTANIGDTVTATATTVNGYSVVLSSNDVNIGADGTFTMPAKNVTVTATYTQATELTSENTTVSVSGTYTYDKTQKQPSKENITVTYNETTTLTEGTDYTIEYGTNVNAGTGAGSVTITGKGNYCGSVDGTFDIEKATITIAGTTVKDKYHDGTIFADGKLDSEQITGIIEGDEDNVNIYIADIRFNNAQIGENKDVSVTYGLELFNSAKGNYQLASDSETLHASIKAWPTTLYVNSAWKSESCGGHEWNIDAFEGIGMAIEWANISDNAVTIIVEEGTYQENINMTGLTVTKKYDNGTKVGRIHLVAEEGKTVTIDGQITFGNDPIQQDIVDVEISGFTFINHEYPIYICNSSTGSKDIVIKDNIINTGSAESATIYINSASIDGLTVTGNTVNNSAGYSMSIGWRDKTIKNVTVSGNTVGTVIGIFGQMLAVESGYSVTVSGNTMSGVYGEEGLWLINTKEAHTGKLLFSGNTVAGACKYVLGVQNYYKSSDIVIGEGNTYGGAAITGWAAASDKKLIVTGNAAAGEALYSEQKLYFGGETSFKTVQAAIDAAVVDVTSINDAKTVVLISDVEENITVAKNTYVILDLNGHVLKAKDAGSVITNNGTLKIIDSSPNTEHQFDKTNALWTLVVDEVEPGENIPVVKGGVITGGTGTVDGNITYGGGVYNNGALTMTGGNIVGNTATCGGGIDDVKTSNISGVYIAGNTAVGEDAIGGGINADGSTTITNTVIKYNTSDDDGGGIAFCIGAPGRSLSIGDGTVITDNASKSEELSGGVYVCKSSIYTVTVSGKVIIKDNTTNSAPANLCLDNQTELTVDGLSEGSDIHVAVMNKDSAISARAFTSGTVTEADAAYFTSDSLAFDVNFVAATTDPQVAAHLELKGYDIAKVTDTAIGVTLAKDDMSEETALAIAKASDGTYSVGDMMLYANASTEGEYKCIKYASGAWESGSWTVSLSVEGTKYVIGEVVEPKVAKVGETEYATLAAAVAAAEDAGTQETPGKVVLLDDVSENITVAAGKYVTIDLNGKTLTATGTAITNNGTLTVTDLTTDHNGKISVSSTTGNAVGINNNAGAVLTVENATIESGTCESSSYSAAVDNCGTAYIKTGAVLKADAGSGYSSFAIYAHESSVTEITGGDMSVSGGSSKCVALYAFDDAKITVEGVDTEIALGSTTASGGQAAAYAMDGATVEIKGGKIIGAMSKSQEGGTVTLKGGLFSADVSDYCAEDYECVANTDSATSETYGYKVQAKAKVAKVGGTEYTTLAAAVAAAETAGTQETPGKVVLLDDVVLADNLTINSGKYVIIDLNDHVLSGGSAYGIVNNGTLKITDDSSKESDHYWVPASGLWVLQDSVPTSGTLGTDYFKTTGGCITGLKCTSATAFDSLCGGLYNAGALTLENIDMIGNTSDMGGAIYNSDGCSLTMVNCDIMGNTAGYVAGGIANRGTATITGGKIAYNTSDEVGGIWSKANLILDGVTITNNSTGDTDNDYPSAGVYCYKGTVTLKNKIVVKDNKSLKDNANFVVAGAVLLDIANLGANSEIGISKLTSDDEVTCGAFTTNGVEAAAAYFTSDSLAYKVKFVAATTDPEVDAHLELADKSEVTVTSDTTEIKWVKDTDFSTKINVIAKDIDGAAVTGLTYTYKWYDGGDDVTADEPYAETPTEVGKYQVVISVADEQAYHGTSDPITLKVVPVPVDDDHDAVTEDYTFTPGSEETVEFVYPSEPGDFVSLTVSKDGGAPETLTKNEDYTVTDGSTKITLTEAYLATLDVGEYKFVAKSKLPGGEEGVDFVEVTFKLNAGSPCRETTYVNLKEGEQTLVLGGRTVGTFVIAKSGKGYTVYDKVSQKYVGFDSEKQTAVMTGTAYVWSYDGGLYAAAKTSIVTRFLWWSYTTSRTTNYYLAFGSEFTVNSGYVKAQVIEIVVHAAHEYCNYTDNGDGTHTGTCRHCNAKITENHTFDGNGKCTKCGKLKPDVFHVTGATVTEKVTYSYTGWFIFLRKTAVYQYTIEPTTEGVDVAKVEYCGENSANNSDWRTGRIVSSQVQLSDFYIRITDSNGEVTVWYWNGSTVVPAVI